MVVGAKYSKRREWITVAREKIEAEEVGGKGVPSRLAIFHGVLIARKGFQRRTVLPEAVLQTRDKGSPVPRFRRRETAAAKALAPLRLILASQHENVEETGERKATSKPLLVATQCPFSSFLPPPAPLVTVNSVNICLSCLTIRLLRPFRFLRGFLMLVVLVSAKYRELANVDDATLPNIRGIRRRAYDFEDTQILNYLLHAIT